MSFPETQFYRTRPITGQHRLIRRQPCRLQNDGVCRYPVARFQLDDIVRHQFGCCNGGQLPIPPDTCFRRRHIAQCVQRFLRFELLHKTHNAVQEDNHGNRQCFGIFPCQDADHRSTQQHQCQKILKLADKHRKGMHFFSFCQPVFTILFLFFGRFPSGQSARLFHHPTHCVPPSFRYPMYMPQGRGLDIQIRKIRRIWDKKNILYRNYAVQDVMLSIKYGLPYTKRVVSALKTDSAGSEKNI